MTTEPHVKPVDLEEIDTKSEAIRFLDFLFEPGEIFEIRTKPLGGEFAKSYWQPIAKKTSFAAQHLDIHKRGNKHVWVGVLPREKNGDKHPVKGKTLWVDLDDTITTPEQAVTALNESGLPLPSMVVWSGGGFHFYWKLDKYYTAEEIRPYSKGLHSVLPSDSTHDPTRVMRVPGSYNPKRERTANIVDQNDKFYGIEIFPKAEMTPKTTATVEQQPFSSITSANHDILVGNWFPGQLHYMTLATAGYLRKDLGYPETEAVKEISSIFTDASLEIDDHAVRQIEHTYAQPLEKIAGTSKLYEMGIMIEKPKFKANIGKPKTKLSGSPMLLIDPEDEGEQEFWMDGFLGPGLMALWVAEQKTGKSFAAMQIAHAMSTGQNLWDFDVTGKHRVLYFQGELRKEMVTERWDGMFGKASRKNVRQIAMTDKPNEVVDLVENPEILMDIAGDYDVIIVDPISVFHSVNENKTREVNDFLNLFRPMLNAGKTVLLVHHTRKLQTSSTGKTREPSFADVRGAGAFTAYVDATILQYQWGTSGNTKAKFQYRAAQDRDDLELFRMSNGGFSHDKQEYLDERKLDGKNVVKF